MAALTYLQLCNRLVEKCGITGGGLSSTLNQTGEPLRVVNWINEAYLNIQELKPNWNWMETDVSFTTTVGQASYTPAQCNVTDHGSWYEDSFRVYITSVGVGSETFLQRMDYEDYRDTYLFNNIRNTTGRPISIAVGPDESLNLGLCPDTLGYTVVGKRYRTPKDLSGDTDVPLLPERFHMLLVYEAMQSYAAYEAAQETMAEGIRQYRRMYRRLEQAELPWITVDAFQ